MNDPQKDARKKEDGMGDSRECMKDLQACLLYGPIKMSIRTNTETINSIKSCKHVAHLPSNSKRLAREVKG